MTTYASVCSGIESPSVAWADLGWKPIWFSEIEPNASKVLKHHHHPEVPNLGDMTLISGMVDRDEIQAPDILVGGTPCQAFSVAGLRNGLNDDRGNLTLVFAHLIESCDNQRKRNGLEPVVVVWENVKGVLSDQTNAFGNYLSLLVGEDEELKRPNGKWTNAGCVFGPQRAVAWRVLDAQHFGVPQRRQRVFLIGSARKGFRPHEVLFEFEGVRRDSAPSRETRKDHPNGTEAGFGSGRKGIELAGCITTGEGSRYDMETCSLIPIAFNHQSGGSLMNLQPSENLANTIQRSQGQAISFGFEPGITQREGNPARFSEEMSPMLRADAGDNQVACISVRLANTSSNGCGFQPEVNHTLDRSGPNAVFCDVYNQVRKLTPKECERLMGFPDDYTAILADSNRYKVLGNSIVTNCLRWIGTRTSSSI